MTNQYGSVSNCHGIKSAAFSGPLIVPTEFPPWSKLMPHFDHVEVEKLTFPLNEGIVVNGFHAAGSAATGTNAENGVRAFSEVCSTCSDRGSA